jgi:hypothetical protein
LLLVSRPTNFYSTTYTTVVSEQIRVPGRQKDDVERLVSLCKSLSEPTLIFCKSPARVNEVARVLISSSDISSHALKPADFPLFTQDARVPDSLQGDGLLHHARGKFSGGNPGH